MNAEELRTEVESFAGFLGGIVGWLIGALLVLAAAEIATAVLLYRLWVRCP